MGLQEQDRQEDEEQSAHDNPESARFGSDQPGGADEGARETGERERRDVAPHDLTGGPEPVEGGCAYAQAGKAVGRDGHVRREAQEDEQRDRQQTPTAHRGPDDTWGNANEEDGGENAGFSHAAQ